MQQPSLDAFVETSFFATHESFSLTDSLKGPPKVLPIALLFNKIWSFVNCSRERREFR